MAKFRKKPVVIDALQFSGGFGDGETVIAWMNDGGLMRYDDERGWAVVIETLEGEMSAFANDWIIRGVAGEFYPCKPDIFAATYEPAE